MQSMTLRVHRPRWAAFTVLAALVSLSSVVWAQAQSGAPGLQILEIEPAEGAVGTEIMILYRFTSERSRDNEPTTLVAFGPTNARADKISDDTIVVRVPEGLEAGEVPVSIRIGGLRSQPKPFRVTASTDPTPLNDTVSEDVRIVGVTPEHGPPRTLITIELNLDFSRTDDVELIINNQVIMPRRYPPSIITAYIPDGASTGPLRLQVAVDGTRSAPFIFTVEGDKQILPSHDETNWLLYLGIAGIFGGVIAVSIVFWRSRSRQRALEYKIEQLQATESQAANAGVADHSPEPSTPPVELPPPTPPADLIEAITQGDCVLYAGAGLSARVGLPAWQPLVEKLLNWAAVNRHIQPKMASSLHAALAAGQLDEVADAVVGQLRDNEPVLREFLQGIFIRPDQPLSRAHEILGRVGFSSALTTNFDDLLETTFADQEPAVITPDDAGELLAALTRRSFFIAKLYGSINSNNQLIIAPADYEDHISSNEPLIRFMESIFFSRTLLFLGASLDGIEDYLSGFRFRKHGDHRHYALVAVSGTSWEVKAKVLEQRYGIHVLPFQLDRDFSGFLPFLQELENQVRLATSEQNAAAGKSGSTQLPPGKRRSGLRRIQLENVGPFEHLDLELDDGWNMLLGDNGVGKSTILKAIAVAICGENASPWAGRLIRQVKGKPLGLSRITLITDRDKYVTTLEPANQGCRVTSLPGQVLEAEGWLAIGFPPLRSVSWNRPSGPSHEPSIGVTPADLLPLIKGEPDPRILNLKQWIVNLDYLRQSKGEGARANQILNDFSLVIDKLTKGMKLEIADVNPDTFEITVLTDDGVVPIEMVSQGTTSLLGWSGIMLQRLYEVFENDIDPKQRYTLVLIDEIDAHMHPEWQQAIVPALSSVFENAQFIATTHSPLIVTGLPVEQVVRFGRDGSGQPVPMPIPEDMTMGRADQILTSSLFGLDTTLDEFTQEKIEVYQDLLAQKNRTRQQEASLRQLEDELGHRIPIPAEGPVERRALELMDALLQAKLGPDHAKVQEAMLERLRLLLGELDRSEGGAQ